MKLAALGIFLVLATAADAPTVPNPWIDLAGILNENHLCTYRDNEPGRFDCVRLFEPAGTVAWPPSKK